MQSNINGALCHQNESRELIMQEGGRMNEELRYIGLDGFRFLE
jgi:hypothetical protein